MENILTDSNYVEVVEKSDIPVMIDFWAEWCGPCKGIAPTINQLTTEYSGKVKIVKCDIDENPELAIKFNIRNIPTFAFVKNGECLGRLSGAMSKTTISDKIDHYFK